MQNEITRLIVTIFRVNGALLTAGDKLTANIGLTSARWQVLGAASSAETPITVAAIAKNMGLTRQNVRIIVRELEAAGMVRLASNPSHQRANLVVVTAKGRRAKADAMSLQKVFVAGLSQDLDVTFVADCANLLQTIAARLKSHNEQV